MSKRKPKVKGTQEKRVRTGPVIGKPKEKRPEALPEEKGFAIVGGVMVSKVDEMPSWSRHAKPKPRKKT